MDITGKIIAMEPTTQVSDKFRKREFVIEYATNPQYPEFVKFELVQDKCDIMDSFGVGQEVQVHFDVRGRKYNDRTGQVKYFNSLQAWRISAAGTMPATPSPNAQQPLPATNAAAAADGMIPF